MREALRDTLRPDLRAAIRRVQEAELQFDNAREAVRMLEGTHLELDAERALEEARTQRRAAYQALSDLTETPAAEAAEAPHHPIVAAVAAINPTLSTRVARARTN